MPTKSADDLCQLTWRLLGISSPGRATGQPGQKRTARPAPGSASRPRSGPPARRHGHPRRGTAWCGCTTAASSSATPPPRPDDREGCAGDQRRVGPALSCALDCPSAPPRKLSTPPAPSTDCGKASISFQDVPGKRTRRSVTDSPCCSKFLAIERGRVIAWTRIGLHTPLGYTSPDFAPQPPQFGF